MKSSTIIIIMFTIITLYLIYLFNTDLINNLFNEFIIDLKFFIKFVKRELGIGVEFDSEKEMNKQKNYEAYNKLYNMNYFNNTMYYDSDLENMLKTEAFVMAEPEEFEIYIYDEKIKLYKTDILYKIENKYYDKEEQLVLFFNEFENEPYEKLIKFPQKNIINKYVYIKTPIVTHRKLDRGNYIMVYYENDENGSRIAPPFLPEKYIYYKY